MNTQSRHSNLRPAPSVRYQPRKGRLDASDKKTCRHWGRNSSPSITARRKSGSRASPSHPGGEVCKAHKRTPYLFDVLDRDQSGTLSRSEVVRGIARMITDQHVDVTSVQLRHIERVLIPNADTDGTGVLCRREFGKFLFQLARTLDIPLGQLAKKLMDSNNKYINSKDADPAQSDAECPVQSDAEKAFVWETLVPALFAKLDTSNDGAISRHEISVAMRKVTSPYTDASDYNCAYCPKLSLSYAEVMSLFDQTDSNGDGELTKTDFSSFVSNFSLACGVPLRDAVLYLTQEVDAARTTDLALEGLKMVPHLFRYFDDDHDGQICRQELVEHMGMLVQELGLDLTLADVWGIFGDAEDGHSHALDRHEFGHFLSQFAKRGNVTVDEVTFYLSKLQGSINKGEGGEKEGNTRHIKMMKQKHNFLDWGNLEQLFQIWDADKDGHIDKRELFAVTCFFRHPTATPVSAVEVLQILHDVDEDQDGTLDRREIVRFLSDYADRAGIDQEELTQHLIESLSSSSLSSQQSSPTGTGKTIKRPSLRMFLPWIHAQLAEEALETVNQVRSSSSRQLTSRLKPTRSQSAMLHSRLAEEAFETDNAGTLVSRRSSSCRL